MSEKSPSFLVDLVLSNCPNEGKDDSFCMPDLYCEECEEKFNWFNEVRNQTIQDVLKIIDEIDPNLVAYKRLKEEIKNLKSNSQETKASILNDKAQDLSDEVANRSSVEQNPDANTKNLKGCRKTLGYDGYVSWSCGDNMGKTIVLCEKCQGKVKDE